MRVRSMNSSRLGLLFTMAMVASVPALSVNAVSSSPTTVSGVLTLNCRESSAILPPVRKVGGFEVLLGAVALQLHQVLAPTRSEFDEPAARLFAKTGLVVRSDGDVLEIRLMPRSRDHARIAWVWRPAVLGVVVRVPRCPARDGRQWLAFPGGYYVEKESCIDLEVRKGRQIKRFSIGVGVPCPGN